MSVLSAFGLVEHKAKIDPSSFDGRIMLRLDMTIVPIFPHPVHLMASILLARELSSSARGQ
jgi:hypothetical protein